MIKGSLNTILEELNNIEYGEHVIVIHPNLNAFRKIYGNYTKNQLTNNNGTVLLAPHYESINAIKSNLGVSNHSTDDSDPYLIIAPSPIDTPEKDLQKYEKDGSLMIVDSLKAHFDNHLDIKSFIRNLIEHAKNTGKDGVSAIVDMGSFYHHNKIDELIEHELSIPSKYHNMKLKRFCIYHQKDFDRLKKEQKDSLYNHHSKKIVVVTE